MGGTEARKENHIFCLPVNKDAENRQQLHDVHEPGVGKDRRIQTERVKQQLCRSREKRMAFMPFFLRTRILREAATATRTEEVTTDQ
jgi:hypothetical protein